MLWEMLHVILVTLEIVILGDCGGVILDLYDLYDLANLWNCHLYPKSPFEFTEISHVIH